MEDNNERNHQHECNCENDGCNCGHEEDRVVLTLEDDTEVECSIVTVFELEGMEYIALNPVDDDEILIYRFVDTDEGADIEFIESDEEYGKVTEAFYQLMNEEEE